MSKDVKAVCAVLFAKGPVRGRVEVKYGKLGSLRAAAGKGSVDGERFDIASGDSARLEITVSDANLKPGKFPTIVTVKTDDRPFSFFLRDVNVAWPIYIPE